MPKHKPTPKPYEAGGILWTMVTNLHAMTGDRFDRLDRRLDAMSATLASIDAKLDILIGRKGSA